LLVLVMILTGVALAAVALTAGGTRALLAELAAGVVCLAAGLVALLATSLVPRSAALYGMLIGMLLRMGLPLAAALVWRARGGPLVEAGAIYYLIPFYLVMLLVETLLQAPQQMAPGAAVSASLPPAPGGAGPTRQGS
jgi:hypothetical protein